MTELYQHNKQDAASISPFISAADLHAIHKQQHVKLLDIRGTWKSPARSLLDNYLAGHIPRAIFVDWTQHFLEQDTPLNLASVANFEQAQQSFHKLGINRDDLVVVYDDYSHMFAGRIWWAMRYWGFNNVKVLNGGWHYWRSQGFPVSTEEYKSAHGTFTPQACKDLRINLEDFIDTKDQACVIDGRGEANYKGDTCDAKSGHIPGAINVPFKSLLDEKTGLFLPPKALEILFNTLTPNWRETMIISSCGSGYAGTVPMLALKQLGISSRLFDQSIAHWKLDTNRPLEQSN